MTPYQALLAFLADPSTWAGYDDETRRMIRKAAKPRTKELRP